MQNSAPLQSIHNFCAAHERCYGQAASESFAESHQVGRELVILLTTTGSNAESRDRLVQNEDNSVGSRQLLQALQKSLGWRDDAHVSHYAFGDDRRDLAWMISNSVLKCGQIIPRNYDRVINSGAIQTGTVRNLHRIAAESQSCRRQDVRTDQQVIVPAMIVAFEFENFR